jgi:hypothetical protein
MVQERTISDRDTTIADFEADLEYARNEISKLQ